MDPTTLDPATIDPHATLDAVIALLQQFGQPEWLATLPVIFGAVAVALEGVVRTLQAFALIANVIANRMPSEGWLATIGNGLANAAVVGQFEFWGVKQADGVPARSRSRPPWPDIASQNGSVRTRQICALECKK